VSRPFPDEPETRDKYRYFQTITTRWMDNDVYGHVNNVVYYSYVDTVANRYLIEQDVLDIEHGDVIGVAVESMCQFRRALSFPEIIEGGLRTTQIGNSSVRYEIGLFGAGESEAAAIAYFVHVFVDRGSRKPVAIPDKLREALEAIYVG
jgi:acyl-CoA thioester hydrolase